MTDQYLRKASLIVGTEDAALDLSELRFRFAIRRGDMQTPNTADIRVYNVSDDTANRILGLLPRPELARVVIQGGYEGNSGLLFRGTLVQVRRGRESQTDTYIDITAADGDEAYNYSVSALSLAAGSTPADAVQAILKDMAMHGVTEGYISDLKERNALPRGKVIYGMSRDEMRKIAENAKSSWSIQDGKLQIIPLGGYIPTGRKVPAIDNTEKINALIKQFKTLQAEFDELMKQGYAARNAGNEDLAMEYFQKAKVVNDKKGAINNEALRLKSEERPESYEGIPEITSATGMIGLPEQTQNGINVRTLLNPAIKIGHVIKLNNSSIQQYRYTLTQGKAQLGNHFASIQAKTNNDGLYYVMRVEHMGDTRGNEWYSDLWCLAVDATLSPDFSITDQFPLNAWHLAELPKTE